MTHLHTTPNILKTVWYLLLVVLFFNDIQAQSYITDVRKLSVEDGLSNRFVTSICKDSRGFMWIGTRYGLNRYDGYTFKHYTKENNALTTNYINKIYEDQQQRLWIIQKPSKAVIDIMDLHTGRIQNFDTIFKNLSPFKAQSVTNMYSGAEKTLWITTDSGKIYRYKNNRFEYIFTETKDVNIFYAGKDILWLLYRQPPPQSNLLTGVHINTGTAKIFDLPQGLLPAGIDDRQALWLFQPEEKKFLQADWEKQLLQSATLLPPELPEFASLVTFARKRYLNPPGNFIWWLSGSKKFRSGFPIAQDLKEKISCDFRDHIAPLLTYGTIPLVEDVCFDTENRLWMATQDGIFILSLKKNNFTTVTPVKGENYSARGIAEDSNGIIYVSTYSGWLQLHPQKGLLKTNKLPTSTSFLIKDPEGAFWFSRLGHTIRYDPVSKKIRYHNYNITPNQPLQKQWTLMHDTRGRIWIGTRSGIYTLEPETGRFRKFTRYNTFSELKNSNIYHLQEAEEGIWIGASSGLYLLEPGKGITTRYSAEQPLHRYIPHNHILHFHRDAEGVFWLATKGGGLIRLDPETGSSRQFTTKEGLSGNIIYAVYKDDYGKLWLPGNYGLIQFDKKSHRVATWLKGDGIAHNEFNTGSHYRASDGKLYFGGLAGVTSFHPKDFVANDPIPTPLQITGCQVLNTKTGVFSDRTETISTSGELVLSPSDKSLLIEFALLNFKNIQTNTYAYKIEGLDKDWTPIRSNSLRLNALPSGKYTLRIKGQGIGGEQSANTLSIKIFVHKPFYLKNGFILSCIAALALLIYGIFRWRLQRLRRSEIRLRAIVTERTKEIQQQKDKIEHDKNTIEQQAGALRALNATQARWFNNIAHELRTPLTLVQGPIRRFLKKYPDTFGEDTRDIQLAGKNTRNLLKLVDDILEVSRLDSDRIQLNKAPTLLSRIIRDATAQFESLARQKGITLASHIHDDMQVNIDSARIRNILVNLISNALKFTHTGGNVSISLRHKTGKAITITVADTGDGISEKDLPHIFERYFQVSAPGRVHLGGAGIGLSLSLELARLHGGDLTAQSQLGEGSSFTFSLPQSLVTDTVKPMTIPMATTLPEVRTDFIVDKDSTTQDKPHILLVEDHPDMRYYMRSFMDENYRIAEASDGLEALEYLKKATPELIISDIMMPRMDGIALAKTLKADDNLRNLPFITLTARTGEADKIATLRIGIDDYLTKPFNPEELEARANNLIRNYRGRKAALQADPGEITTPGYKEARIKVLKETVLNHLEDPAFTAEDLAATQNMSLSSLRRFLKKTTGLSPGQFIREIRLQRALKLFEAKQYSTVVEVAYTVGFENASHFTKLFLERFGKRPSEYL